MGAAGKKRAGLEGGMKGQIELDTLGEKSQVDLSYV
jgi:hypothetical protein